MKLIKIKINSTLIALILSLLGVFPLQTTLAQDVPINPGYNIILGGNTTIIGWEGDKDVAIVKENGWIYIRDSINTIASYMASANAEPGKYKWYPYQGYLPCFITEFKENENGCTVKISNFVDKVTINSHDFKAIPFSKIGLLKVNTTK